MATSTPVRTLQSSEIAIICSALELQAKSNERAARASANSVIANEYTAQAGICRNLISHFRNGSLAV